MGIVVIRGVMVTKREDPTCSGGVALRKIGSGSVLVLGPRID